MKTSLVILLLGAVLPAVTFAEKIEAKKKHENDVNDDDVNEEEEEGEWDIEREVFGPQVERFQGLHILDENMNIIISEPSDRVLRAISGPKKEGDLTLEKVKALYKEKMERDERKTRWLDENRKNGGLLNQDFEQLLAKEQKVAEQKAAADDSIVKRVMDFFW
ncbi:uncharacterized protein [Macrobrachium rosenbergii]|uniref:uncharacterized protein n=1 Tax=Macrobrachium rosenbergii TaxID=79674 RepID=UPI0034D4FFB9